MGCLVVWLGFVGEGEGVCEMLVVIVHGVWGNKEGWALTEGNDSSMPFFMRNLPCHGKKVHHSLCGFEAGTGLCCKPYGVR